MAPEKTLLRKSDRLWLGLLVVVGGALSIRLATNLFDATVSLSGLLCVGLIALGRREGFLIGLYNSVFCHSRSVAAKKFAKQSESDKAGLGDRASSLAVFNGLGALSNYNPEQFSSPFRAMECQ